MSPVLPRFPTPPPILGGSGRVCHSPSTSCPSTHLGWLWALSIVTTLLEVNCVFVRLRFIPFLGFVMWCISCTGYISTRRDSADSLFTLLAPQVESLRQCRSLVWPCRPLAAGGPAAWRLGRSAVRALGARRVRSPVARSSFPSLLLRASSFRVPRLAHDPAVIQVRSVVFVGGIGALVGWPQGLWSLSS